jgi:glycosyltransferase involved in cell wall biosynthesis
MKVIHCPTDVAGQAWLLAREQRKLGIKSDIMVFNSSKYYTYKYDYNFYLEKFPRPLKYLVGSLKGLGFLAKALINYDVFHFHSKSIFPNNFDMPLERNANKKIVFHFHGCDARLAKHGVCAVCERIGRKSKLNLIKNVKKYANLTIVVSPDLLKELPGAVWIDDSVDIDVWKPGRKVKKDETIRILHSPTDRLVKGTRYVEEAVEKLKKNGYDVELLLLQNVPNTKVKELAQRADIAVDQLLVGWYGVLGIETMALGIPTCAHIREDLKWYSRGNPIVDVSQQNLYEKLRTLIEDESLRKKIGKRSIDFVRERHDSLKNAKKIVNIYENLF